MVLQGTAKKCRKIYNARAQLLFYSVFNPLFSDFLVAVVVVVVCFNKPPNILGMEWSHNVTLCSLGHEAFDFEAAIAASDSNCFLGPLGAVLTLSGVHSYLFSGVKYVNKHPF